MKLKDEIDFPILLAIPSEDGTQYRAWCPYCVKFHFHSPGEGHKAAHCFNPQSPFRNGGYVLLLEKNANKVRRLIERRMMGLERKKR